MKKLLIGLFILSLAYLPVDAQNGQRRNVPAVVLNAFQQQFPKARQVEWEKERDGNYEVEFDVGLFGRDHKAIISPEGRVLRHEEELSSGSLPDAVKEKIKVAFDGYRVEDVKKINVDNSITYKVELDGRPDDLDVIFASDGEVVSERRD